MSHLTDIKTLIRFDELNSLESCLDRLGLELVRNVPRYKWYGTHVGDYPLPEGFTKDELGMCEHVIRIKPKLGETEDEQKAREKAYEIGVVRRKDGQGYTLMFDFWMGGYGIEALAGKNCCKIMQAFGEDIVTDDVKTLLMQGWQLDRQVQQNGDIKIRLIEGKGAQSGGNAFGGSGGGDAFGGGGGGPWG